MGNTESMESQLAVIRARAAPVKLPMPDPAELEERFSIALNSMNLPPDKVRLLRCYDNEKKWELICDQERFQVKNPPHTYIQKLRGFLDPAVTRKKFRRRVQESTQVLRELEISLRTNHIGWVREFLNEENQGLDVLVEYLSFAQYAVTFDGEVSEASTEERAVDSPWSRSIEDLHGDSNLPSPSSGNNVPRSSRHSIGSALVSRSNTLPSRKTLKNSRLVCKKDDVHVCVMCLRAIMNYQYGFNMVMSHPHAVNEIALSLNNRNPRTKALVLELLAAVCLVRGGHEIILSAFDNFKTVCSETLRFEKLMEHFKNEDDNIDFMVACMQFINIVVHSVEDMNFRVHLQYDFTKLNLDDYLERLKHTESDRLQVQIQAYLDNVFDVGTLLEDAETKTAALERVEELEENMTHMTERLLDTENEAMAKIVELEKQLMQTNKELDTIRDVYASANNQVHTLRRIVREKDQTIRRQSRLERHAQEGGRGHLGGSGDSGLWLVRGGTRDDASPSPSPTTSTNARDAREHVKRALPCSYSSSSSPTSPSSPLMFHGVLRSSASPSSPMRPSTPRLWWITTVIFNSGLAEGSLKLFCRFPLITRLQLHAIIAASVSIKSSQKLKKILEIILALGNYMNSSKRGAVYGFKLQSLDLLLETKTTDRKQTLLHYIANVVREKYPGVALFYNELHYVEKAAAVSLENVVCDVKECQRGMDLSWREYSMHGHNPLLKDFISKHETRLQKLQEDAHIAQDAFDDAVKHFGESSKTMPPSVFFPVFVRFIKAYRLAEEENEQRRRQEQALIEKLEQEELQQEQEAPKSPSNRPKQRQQESLITELRRRQGGKDSRHVYEGKDGAIEDIITVLKTVPFTARTAKRSSRFFCDPTHTE
ncbi:formin-like protein 2 [Oncorhynchus mykiss]|uniref:formin-like protein 2 n=1 Tax=Oncorhynchus mykiss TaxID=8022 RepID=UPI001877805A|nr:formin-like protein 2 [Oncorhynchus mykiss]